MLFLQISLLDLTISSKEEIVDCYTAASNVRFISLRGNRSFRLYLAPSGKEECKQLPRGLNVTIFATKLVDGSNNFIPNSFIVVNFSYSTTVGINIPCTQCTNDNYLGSDQVIVTMESAIHFTRVVMGAVQTEKGLQVNCFRTGGGMGGQMGGGGQNGGQNGGGQNGWGQNGGGQNWASQMIVDFNYISFQATPSGSCPQLVSADPTKLKALVQADLFIIYQDGSVDRYEKLNVGTDIISSSMPPSATAVNTYNVTMSNIGRKPILEAVQLIQLQLYFANTGIPLMATVQANTISLASFQRAFKKINMKVQQDIAFLDLEVNTQVVQGTPLFQSYNTVLQALQPDKIELQFSGYSKQISSSLLLDQTFVTDSATSTYQEPSMSFSMDLDSFTFQNMKMQIDCNLVKEKNCVSNLQRYLNTNDSTFQFNMFVKFYKNGIVVKAMNQPISRATSSCFEGATGFLGPNSIEIQLQQNKEADRCALNVSSKIDLLVNLSKTDRISKQNTIQQITVTNIEFKYNISLPLTETERAGIVDYLASNSSNNLAQILSFVNNGTIVDYASLAEFQQSDLAIFQKSAKQAILIVGVVALCFCTISLLYPIARKTIQPKLQKNRQLKLKVANSTTDKYDL
ncbi:Conserved_hypothetical protein [Hexamita inflata]|uniref:Transmembrane protein n=1 Tax=Hexamita inflata TaxID=28002 RepID=A0AA86U0Z7_9EUKA|nr:Conserved hypothetical protein [Hexamita inflata]